MLVAINITLIVFGSIIYFALVRIGDELKRGNNRHRF